MYNRAKSKSGRRVRSVNIGWQESLWRPRIRRGTLVSGPAGGRPDFDWSLPGFKRDCPSVLCTGLAAGVPLAGLFGAILPERPRIQFPTL